MTIVNFSDLAVTCEAPTNHKTMSVADRVCNVLSGFALLDLLKITAELECSRRSLPRGSLWLAPETHRNLQHCALGLLSVCLSKQPKGSPWLSGQAGNRVFLWALALPEWERTDDGEIILAKLGT